MSNYDKYSIDLEVKFKPLEIIDFREVIANCKREWQNISLCKINDSIARLAVIEGKFHWHKHEKEDEFFFVIEGELLIDLEDKTIKIKSNQGFTVPMGINHRTRAPTRTAVLLIEKSTITPTGD
jgi:mannose-6-phosphate isomerase-like protein (cupin superfamily)